MSVFDGLRQGSMPPLLDSLLSGFAGQQPDKILFTHLSFDGAEPVQLSYGELARRARGIAGMLHARGLRQRPVLLLYPAGPDFAPAFFGALLAGAIAVPVPVPQFSAQYARLGRIVDDCRPAAILSTAALHARLKEKVPADSPLRACSWLDTDSPSAPPSFDAPPADPSAPVLIQYTSGSTAEPKGVVLTHANLAHNLRMITRDFRIPTGARIVSWLPHFHDMGLIAGFAVPLACAGEAILMSPLAFLHRPLRWLQTISDYRAQSSGAPNFAYELCVKWAERVDHGALDLSSWRNAFVGAEPVRAATLDAFAERFRTQGFQRSALTPCYGMAEATLLVSCKPAGTLPHTHALARAAVQEGYARPSRDGAALKLTSCGRVASGTALRIVDPERRVALPAGRIGEVWIDGPQVARGYWNRPDDALFGAALADADAGDGAWLRTGDLGFLSPTGEFVFVDRLKDLVILNGQNFVCHDLELCAGASHALLSADGCMVCSVDDGDKAAIVVAAEISPRAVDHSAELAAAIRAALFSTHELAVRTIVFVPPRKLCRTTSGKLQRKLTARRLLDGTMKILARHGDPLPQIPQSSAKVTSP